MINLYNFLAILVIVLTLIFALVYSFFVRKKQNNEVDKSVSGTVAKHPVLANPILIGYIVFPVLVVIGAIILYYML